MCAVVEAGVRCVSPLAFAIDALWDVRRDLIAEQAVLIAREPDMRWNQEAQRILGVNQAASIATEAFRGSDLGQLDESSSDPAATLAAILRIATFDVSAGSWASR